MTGLYDQPTELYGDQECWHQNIRTIECVEERIHVCQECGHEGIEPRPHKVVRTETRNGARPEPRKVRPTPVLSTKTCPTCLGDGIEPMNSSPATSWVTCETCRGTGAIVE